MIHGNRTKEQYFHAIMGTHNWIVAEPKYLIGEHIPPIEWGHNFEERNNSAGNNHNNLEGEADNHGDHDACNPQKN